MLQETSVKGIARYLLDDRLAGDPLRLHVSQLAPGAQSHPPHEHPGVEALYILAGEGMFVHGDQRTLLRAGDATLFDPRQLHQLVNSGDVPLHYVVIIRSEAALA